MRQRHGCCAMSEIVSFDDVDAHIEGDGTETGRPYCAAAGRASIARSFSRIAAPTNICGLDGV